MPVHSLKACRFHESASLMASRNALRSSGVSFRVIRRYLLQDGYSTLPVSFPQVGTTGSYHRFQFYNMPKVITGHKIKAVDRCRGYALGVFNLFYRDDLFVKVIPSMLFSIFQPHTPKYTPRICLP
jgi:hypothetical protein